MSNRKFLPSTVEDLINHLDKMFPDSCIGHNETVEHAHRRSGSRDVVKYLRNLQSKESSRELDAHKRF